MRRRRLIGDLQEEEEEESPEYSEVIRIDRREKPHCD